jgi:hypothetical protein
MKFIANQQFVKPCRKTKSKANTLGSFSNRPVMDVIMASGNESFEQRMRLVWLALELGMKLARNIKWMVLQFDHLHQLRVW